MFTMQSWSPWLGSYLLGGLFILLVCTTCGSSLFALYFETVAWKNKRPFLSKLARHCLNLALAAGLASVLFPVATLAIAIQIDPVYFPWSFWPIEPYFAVPALLFSLGLGALVLTSQLWEPCRGLRVLRLMPCTLASLGFASALYAAHNGIAFWLLDLGLSPGGSLWLAPLFPQAPKPLLAASLQLGVIVVAGTASLALLYLLWRRNKDNFGRDYYRYTMSRLAAGAYVLPLLVLGPLTLALSPTNELTRSTIRPQCLITLGTGLLCSLVGLVLARRIHNSQSPMRHKISLLALALLVWLSTSAFFVGYLSLAWPEFQPLSSF